MDTGMNYLLDTCGLLALIRGGDEFSSGARMAVGAPGATLFLSVVSAVELAIKCGKGKLALSLPIEQWLTLAIQHHRLRLLPLELSPSCASGALPWLHHDPFDRILIATAMQRNLIILTSDRVIPTYPGIQTLW